VSRENVVTEWQGGWAVVKYEDGAIARYVSFGEPLDGPGTDSFGVSQDKIFLYSNADEVNELRNGHPDGWYISFWLPVEVGAHVATPPTHLIKVQSIIQPDVASTPYYP
jgi:hypothetical protein